MDLAYSGGEFPDSGSSPGTVSISLRSVLWSLVVSHLLIVSPLLLQIKHDLRDRSIDRVPRVFVAAHSFDYVIPLRTASKHGQSNTTCSGVSSVSVHSGQQGDPACLTLCRYFLKQP